MPDVVYARMGRQQAKELVRSLAGMLTGRVPDTLGIAQGVFLSIGFAALYDIHQAYKVKSRGGTGEDGIKWDPLKPATIAARRITKKDKIKYPAIAERLAAEQRARKEASKSFTQQTNDKLKWFDERAAQRLKEVDQQLRPLINRFKLSLPDDDAVAAAKQRIARRKALLRDQIATERKALASRRATERKAADFGLRGKFAVTRVTGQSRVSILSQREVDILRDTGVGLASLSLGVLSHKGPGATYTKPTSEAQTEAGRIKREGGGQQIFEPLKDGIIIGTNVPYMAKHQTGDPSKNLPARPFLPERVPVEWAQRWAEAGLEALQAGVNLLFQAG